MTTRYRERTLGFITGSYSYGDYHEEKTSVESWQSCTDVADNPGGNNPLLIKSMDRYIGTASGVVGGGVFDSWPLTTQYVSAHVGEDPDHADYVTEVMAKTNPASSEVDLPTFIAETRDLPGLLTQSVKLLRKNGRSLIKRAAEANISYQFGWKPLLGDLGKLYDFQKYTDQRITEFNSLINSGGLKRRAHLGESDDAGPMKTRYVHSTLSLYVRAQMQDHTHSAMWGTCRWVPNPNWASRMLNQTDANAKRRRAIKYALGLDWSQFTSSVWEALPWSWLIDWYADVGDYIQASNNSIAHVSGTVSIMRKATTHRTYTIISKPDNITVSDLSSVYGSKTRSCHAPIPRVTSRPFLSGRRLSILGSLAILRGRK